MLNTVDMVWLQVKKIRKVVYYYHISYSKITGKVCTGSKASGFRIHKCFHIEYIQGIWILKRLPTSINPGHSSGKFYACHFPLNWFYRKLIWSLAEKCPDSLEELFTLQNVEQESPNTTFGFRFPIQNLLTYWPNQSDTKTFRIRQE